MRAVVVSNDARRGRCPWWHVCGVVRQHGDGLDIDRVGEELDDPVLGQVGLTPTPDFHGLITPDT